MKKGCKRHGRVVALDEGQKAGEMEHCRHVELAVPEALEVDDRRDGRHLRPGPVVRPLNEGSVRPVLLRH